MMDRLKEPSTFAGLGLILLGLNELFDINEAKEIGTAIVGAAESGADVNLIVAAGVAAAFAAIFKAEKK